METRSAKYSDDFKRVSLVMYENGKSQSQLAR